MQEKHYGIQQERKLLRIEMESLSQMKSHLMEARQHNVEAQLLAADYVKDREAKGEKLSSESDLPILLIKAEQMLDRAIDGLNEERTRIFRKSVQEHIQRGHSRGQGMGM